jgi:hypothetical protein
MVNPVGPRRGIVMKILLLLLFILFFPLSLIVIILGLLGMEKLYCPICGGITLKKEPKIP